MMYAQEAGKEEKLNAHDETWDRKSWLCKGSRYFAKDKIKLMLDLQGAQNPWEQYQAILNQAEKGEFSATEIKLLMKTFNIGKRVFEAFKLQQEVDTMKAELIEMSQRNGNNIIPITKAKEANQTAL